MNDIIRAEMVIVMNNEKVCEDCQVRILSRCGHFLNNVQYITNIKDILDDFFARDPTMNLFVELPQMIIQIINFHKRIVSNKNVETDYIKFIIYAIIYSYLDKYQSIFLNSLSPGALRLSFANIIDILVIKPKHVAIIKETLWHKITSCICGDEDAVLL